MNEAQQFLGNEGVGFFGMLLIGFLAGYIAERVMERDHGLLTNVFVGIAGSFVAGTLARVIGISFYGFLGNLVIATIGAIAILWIFGKRSASTSRNRGEGRGRNGGTNPHDPMYHTRADDE